MGTYVGEISGSTSDAGGYLTSGWAMLSNLANNAFSQAMSIASRDYSAESPDINVPGEPALDFDSPISTEGEPVAPTLSPPSLTLPTPPVLSGARYTPGAAPTFSSAVPTVAYPVAPTPAVPSAPDAAPAVSNPAMPDNPSVDLPSVPTLRELSLPDAPTVLIPTFSATSPTADLPKLVQPDFIWDEAPYTERLPQLASKIATYIAFDYDAAETAIWERGQERIDRSVNTAVLDLMNDFASRGFALPTGAMTASVMEARAKGVELKSDNAREAMIKAAELNTQKLTLAIESGIKYESMWMNYQTEYAKRAFDAARIMVDVTLKLFDAKVALFNARLQAYQTEAQVHRDLIQAELTKLEVFKTQLEGQKLIGEMNQQDVELYKAMLQGSLAAIEVYKAQVSAVVSTIEVDKAKLQAYGIGVDAYKAQLQANEAEYRAWGEQMRGEAVKAQVYEAEVRAFAARVDAYKAQESVGVESAKLAIMHDENRVREFTAQLSGFESQIKAYGIEADAESKLFDARVKAYASVIGAREAEARTRLASQGHAVDLYKASASIAVEEARVGVARVQAEMQKFVGQMQAAGSIVSQLAASAMSAFNLSASTGESFQLSVGNSLTETHSFTG